MAIEPPPARRGLRRSLAAGGVYDLALGIFILLAGRPVMAGLGHPVPDHAAFYFALGALPLLLLPALYVAASRAADLGPFRLPALWARAGGGGMLVFLSIAFRPEPIWIFLAIGILDGMWAALHAILWRRR